MPISFMRRATSRQRPTTALIPLVFIALLAGCADRPATPGEPLRNDQLYRDFGGQPGVERLIDGMLDNIARDDRIFPIFRDANIDRLRSKLVEKFCSLMGGPCEYTGASIVDAHSGLQITEAQFNALVEDIQKAMESQDIPVAAQNRLLALLAPMRPQVIHR